MPAETLSSQSESDELKLKASDFPPQKLIQFERLIRAVGLKGLKKLENTHLAIVGTGGVGSWAAESLVRSAVGSITLIDFDKVNPSNLNRQLPCLAGSKTGAGSTFGRPKIEVLAERLRTISPWTKTETLNMVYCPQTEHCLWDLKPDIILDCIDNITYKCHLLNAAVQKNIPIVCSTGAGGRTDPTKVRVCDLSNTKIDPVALQVRKKLRRDYRFPSNRSFRIPAVYSEELPFKPFEIPDMQLIKEDPEDPVQKVKLTDSENSDTMEIGRGRHAPPCGTLSFATGAFGLTAASLAVRLILSDFDLKGLY